MSRALFWLVARLIFPVLAWIGIQVLGRLPPEPFLALTPTHSAIHRSLTMAALLAGVLGLAALLSVSAGTWVLAVALVAVGFVAIGCARAFASFWWPVILAAALVLLGLGLALLPNVSPSAISIARRGEIPLVLFVGGLAIFIATFWASTVTVGAMERLAEHEEHLAKTDLERLSDPPY